MVHRRSLADGCLLLSDATKLDELVVVPTAESTLTQRGWQRGGEIIRLATTLPGAFQRRIADRL